MLQCKLLGIADLAHFVSQEQVKLKNLEIKSLFKLVNVSKRGLREVAWMPGIFSSITVATPESSTVMSWSLQEAATPATSKGNLSGGLRER